jgi:glycerol transport system ATP-binding protein
MGIELKNITKYFGRKKALDNISLEIKDGEFVCFLGPSAAGKSVLLRVIAGLEKADSGSVIFDGKDVTKLTVRERKIAMVYQDFINYPNMTVYENIASPLRVAKKYSKKEIDKKEIDKKVHEVAALLDINKILQQHPDEISGGQRQRTAIARAMVKGAKYIFLDEPLANLDYKLREEFRTQLKETFSNREGAFIYATADPIDAMSLSSHTGYLYEGKLLQYGSIEDVYNHPNYSMVGKYFSNPTMNLMEGVLNKREKTIDITHELKIDVADIIDALSGEKYIIGIRPKDIGFKDGPNKVKITGELTLSEIVGSETELHIDYNGQNIIVLEPEIVSYTYGNTIELFLDATKCFVFDANDKKLVAKTGGEKNGNT